MSAEADTAVTADRLDSVDPTAPVASSDTSDSMLQPGEHVDRYVIKREVGSGGMGRVYLARDTELGRRVALKIIHPGLLGPERVQRFLSEGRLTARINHPSIVQVYDVGYFKGRPYLALEYLDGETLRDRQRQRPLGIRAAARLARDLAAGLVEAHDQGVVHCDLTPQNVMITRDGRVRILDFGLATALGSARRADVSIHKAGRGTPPYMSPEQWLGDPLDSATDIWALGVMLFELIERRHPFVDAIDTMHSAVVSPQITPAAITAENCPKILGALVRECLDKQARTRPSTHKVFAELDRIVLGEHRISPPEEGPFRGLRAFEETHSPYFFGREPEVAAFVESLADEPVLPLVGPSGVGKSSFVEAGVIPRLREQGPWVIVRMRPGRDPFRTLALRLLQTTGASPKSVADRLEAYVEQLWRNTAELRLELLRLAEHRRARVLLFVDQLDELPTHVQDAAERRRFLQAIATAADDPDDPIRIIMSLRDDFLSRLAEVHEIRSVFSHVTVLREPSRSALQETLVAPLTRCGYSFDDATLVDTMLDEIEGNVACLPLLQFAAQRLWEERDTTKRQLLRARFTAWDGVAGALADHADTFFRTLPDREWPWMRTMLIRMVSPEGTRRVVGRREALAGLPNSAVAILKQLVELRLVVSHTSDGHTTADGPAYELAHESLVRTWPQLVHWLEETRDERRLAKQLDRAALAWEEQGRPLDALWRGATLRDASFRVQKLKIELSRRATQFLEDGLRQNARFRRHRLARNTGFVVLALTILALLATTTVIRARHATQRAEQDAKVAQAEMYVARARADIGQFDLIVRPFDWDAEPQVAHAVDPALLPALDWRFHRPDREAPEEPGGPIPAEHLTRSEPQPTTDGSPGIVWQVEVRAGPTFLEVFDRGRPGATCRSSWIRLQALPGYAERDSTSPIRIEIRVPTCQASQADLIAVPGGELYRNGPGDPPTRYPDYVQAEAKVYLETFSLDRTEITNVAYAQFAAMGDLTGQRPPVYPHEGLLTQAGDPHYPVTYIDAFEAAAFCFFMGKRLPTSAQWEKAARGGIHLDGAGKKPNPEPRRNVPWAGRHLLGPANLGPETREDDYPGPAPVGSMPDGAGPYGHLDLSGNVYEWTRSSAESTQGSKMREIRGGDWQTPADLEHHTIAYSNMRPPRARDYALGFRCATNDPPFSTVTSSP